MVRILTLRQLAIVCKQLKCNSEMQNAWNAYLLREDELKIMKWVYRVKPNLYLSIQFRCFPIDFDVWKCHYAHTLMINSVHYWISFYTIGYWYCAIKETAIFFREMQLDVFEWAFFRFWEDQISNDKTNHTNDGVKYWYTGQTEERFQTQICFGCDKLQEKIKRSRYSCRNTSRSKQKRGNYSVATWQFRAKWILTWTEIVRSTAWVEQKWHRRL